MLPEPLRRLFAAENGRDWAAFATLLDPDVVWHLHGDRSETVEGREAYLRRIETAYRGRPAASFTVERYRSSGWGRVLVELVDTRGEVSVEVFLLRDGLVLEEHEFFFG